VTGDVRRQGFSGSNSGIHILATKICVCSANRPRRSKRIFDLIEGLGMRILLAIHAILLLLASTNFTIATAFLGKTSLQWCYFKYASSNGWGVEYVSNFTAPEIATYSLAFAVGVIGFSAAIKNKSAVVGMLGVVLSLLGLLSFAIEGSHWFVDHNRSWLAFSPAVMLLLVFLAFLPHRVAVNEDASLNRTIGFDTEST